MAPSPASSKANELGNQAQDAFHGLTNLLTRKSVFTLPSPPLTSSEFAAEPNEPPNEVPESSSTWSALYEENSSSSSQTNKRVKVGDRLKKLSRDLGKFRQIGDKSRLASPRVTVEEIPPQALGVAKGSHNTYHTSSTGNTTSLSIVGEREDEYSRDQNTTNAPEPTSLAKRIEDLVESLPFPTRNKDQLLSTPAILTLPAIDASGRPIPPPDASPIQDPKLLDLLSSPDVMNGSTTRGKPSIWGILEGLLPSSHRLNRADGEAKVTDSSEDQNASAGDQDSMFSDNSSVMVYSPLVPTNEDLVELAELVPVGEQEEPHTDIQSPIAGTSWTTVWPLSVWYTVPASTSQGVSTSRPSTGDTVLSPQRTSIDNTGRPVRVQTVRAWVPSRSKISVQAMWWGYRLYLPPPVLAILSDRTLEATKRAAMITTALTWFFNNLPVNTLPAPVVPAALLLQRLAPFLGYIGTFISWSWSAIKSYDVGHGVILTATWLLPIALIPGTWHEYDFPMSPTQMTPAPLPPMSPPSSPPSSSSPSLPSTSSPTSPAYTFSPISPRSLESPIMQSSASGPSYLSSPHTRYTPLPTESTSIPLYARVLVEIPVSPTLERPCFLPPAREIVPVPLGSPLMEQLLHGPIMHTVPLPEEGEPVPLSQSPPKRKKDSRSRAKALFTRSSHSK